MSSDAVFGENISNDVFGDSISNEVHVSTTGGLSQADRTKLDGIESGATADQTGAEITAAIDSHLASDEWRTQAALTAAIADLEATKYESGDDAVFASLDSADGLALPVLCEIAAGDGITLGTGTKLAGINTDGNPVELISASRFGYAAAYRSLQIGDGSYSYSLGVDLSTIPGGSFSGAGLDIVTKPGAQFLQPNAAGDNFIYALKMTGGKVGGPMVDITDSGATIDGSLDVSGVTTINDEIDAQLSAIGTAFLKASVIGDAQERLLVTTAGELRWGDGTNLYDVNLERSAAGRLKTSGDFYVVGETHCDLFDSRLGLGIAFADNIDITGRLDVGGVIAANSAGSNVTLQLESTDSVCSSRYTDSGGYIDLICRGGEFEISTDSGTYTPIKTSNGDVILGGNVDLVSNQLQSSTQFVKMQDHYEDINVNLSSLGKLGPGEPDLGVLASTTIQVALWDGSSTEEVSSVVELVHAYTEGGDIDPHVHWFATDTGTGDVRWGMEYFFVGADGVVSTSTTIYATEATTGTAWQRIDTGFPTISGTGLTIGTQLHFRFFRDAANAGDTYGSDAATGTFGFHVPVNSIGSDNKTSKT